MTSLLEQEIASQSEVIQRILKDETKRIEKIVAQLPTFDYALIAARGSSDHAATYAKYAWTTLAGYPVALAAPSLLTMYKAQVRLAGALVVGISQSGQSPDIIAVLEEGKRQGRLPMMICSTLQSNLTAEKLNYWLFRSPNRRFHWPGQLFLSVPAYRSGSLLLSQLFLDNFLP